jgi:hypothetical protein
MNTRKHCPPRPVTPAKALRKTRFVLFSLLVVFAAVALGAANYLPAPSFLTQAKQTADTNNDPPNTNNQNSEQISDQVRRQIEALIAEKTSRSAGRRKMDSRLIYIIKQRRHEPIGEGVDSFNIEIPKNQRGEVIVDITAIVSPKLLKKLKQAGARILSSFEEYNSVRAEVDLDAVDAIANFPEVKFIQPMQEAITSQDEEPQDPEHLRTTRPGFEEREQNISQELINALEEFQTNSYNVGNAGVRKAEGDLTHKAALARNTYGFDGTGIKIGVLSDGVRNLAAVQASADLGPVTVLPGQSGTSPGQCAANAACDEGTAMLEIIHDLAPGAQLYFATAFGGSANFANNIRNLRNAGCDIIVDDVFYFAESPFQDGQAPSIISPTNGGIVAQAVNDVTAAGALYFSSAGNSGNKNDGTSGVWEGDFVDGGNAPAVVGGAGAGRVHQFPGGLNFNSVTLVGSSQYNLNWSDPLGGSANDYDLYATNAAGTTLIAASTGNQNGTQDPFEAIGPAPAGSRLIIVRFSGVGRYLRLTTNRGRLNVNTPGQTTGHSCALNAFGVAATPAVGPFPNPFNSTNVVETFSSDGPRKLFFQADGTPFTPGDVSSTGGISRQKPDITAADGVSVTGAGGFGISFFGTSAAAPHSAAIAALLKSANPLLTPTLIRDALQNSAIDIETGGIDRDSGYGIIMADAALQYIGAAPGAANVTLGTVTVSDVGGNGNGFIEPGERGTLVLPLLNTGVNPAMSVTATISSATPGVVITPSGTKPYPDIAATNGSSVSASPYEFVLQPGFIYAANIDFVLTANYNGVTRSFPFIVPTGQLASISTVLDTTAPVSGTNYIATTGLQVSRMNFTFPISGCGTPKVSPGAAVSALTRRYDAYNFTNTSAAPICVTVNLTHSANVLLYVDAYIPTFVPATVATNWVADNGGSATSGAGTTQLFAFNVPAGQTFTVVVSESNSGGAPNVPYNLKVTGLPATAVPANQAPVNAVPGTQTVLEDNTLVFSAAGSNQISISDPDAGNNPVEVTVSATDGLLSLSGTPGLSFSNGDGSADTSMTFTGSINDINNALEGLSYSPAADFNGAATLTLTTNDQGNTGTGGAQSDNDSVNINVAEVNDDPVAAPDSKTTNEDVPLSFPASDLTVNDSAGPGNESSQILTVTSVTSTPNTHGSVTLISGQVNYSPDANYNGPASFDYQVCDDGTTNGAADPKCATSVVNLTVDPVNDAPTAVDDSATTNEDTPVNIDVLANDTDVEMDTLSVIAVTQGAHGSVVNNSGTLTYSPAADYHGTDTFTYTVSDGNGGEATANVSITIDSVNDNPVAVNDSAITNEDTSTTIDVVANDTDVDGDARTLASVGGAAHGSVTIVSGQALYSPVANYNGGDSFTYVVSDGHGGQATGNVSITVNAVNDAPTANNQSVSTNANSSVAITLTGNDVETPSGSLIFTVTSGPTHGSLSGAGANRTYTPALNYSGPDSFKFRVQDTGDGTSPPLVSSEATVSITVGDTLPPVIVCNADIIVDFNPAVNGAVVTYTAPVGTDNAPGATTTQTAGLPSGSTFPLGNTTNTFTVTDTSGNTASCSFKVTVALTSIIGLDSVTITGAAYADSYSSTGSYPATKSSLANVLSNGTITLGNSGKVWGNVRSTRAGVNMTGASQVTGNATAGTTVTTSGSASVGGTKTNNALAPVMTLPAVPTCGPPYSPNTGITGTYSYNSSTGDLTLSGINVATLANGTYCFHNLTLGNSAKLQVNGPVTIKLTGTLNASGASSLPNTTSIPSNLRILSSYSGSGNGVTFGNSSNIHMMLYAPRTGVSISGAVPMFGTVAAKSITLGNSGAIHYDTTLKTIWPALWNLILGP